MGVLTPLCTAPVYTYLQEIVDPAMQGRVFGLLNTTSAFAMPIGALIAGPLADLIPIEWIFIASGILTLPLGWWIYITDDRKNIENSAIAPNLSAR
jgi:DHA3 family macrolide efflux protein-like MFS transporter